MLSKLVKMAILAVNNVKWKLETENQWVYQTAQFITPPTNTIKTDTEPR